MLNDAYKGRYEKAYLITRDSDLLPAVKMIKAEFPKKTIVAVAPPMMGHSNDLIGVCHEKLKIKPNYIHECSLPQHIKDSYGKLIITRPAKYD
jgi:uncharacterized LabA/DUF88 family protein